MTTKVFSCSKGVVLHIWCIEVGVGRINVAKLMVKRRGMDDNGIYS